MYIYTGIPYIVLVLLYIYVCVYVCIYVCINNVPQRLTTTVCFI